MVMDLIEINVTRKPLLRYSTGWITAYASGSCGTEVSVKSSWIWGRCTPLFSQDRSFVTLIAVT